MQATTLNRRKLFVGFLIGSLVNLLTYEYSTTVENEEESRKEERRMITALPNL